MKVAPPNAFPAQESVQQGEAKVRFVPPTLCGSLVASGDVKVYASSYGPLLDFMDSQGYLPVEGFRETCLYWEGGKSKNNIIWIQHQLWQNDRMEGRPSACARISPGTATAGPS